MKFLLTVFCAILLNPIFCNAQKTEKYRMNAVSFELGKTGLIYNLTLDQKSETKNFGFRLGAGSNFSKYLNAFSIGGGGYYLVGRTYRFLELGVDFQYLIIDEISDDQKGFSFVYPDFSTKTFYPSINIGYRNYGKRTLFRIGVSPGIIENSLIPGGYISYGLRV